MHARNFRHFEFFMVLPYCPLKTVQSMVALISLAEFEL